MKHQPVEILEVQQFPPIAVTTEHAAQFLEVSQRTIENMVRDGRLPALHVGRCLRIPVRALVDLADKAYPAMRQVS